MYRRALALILVSAAAAGCGARSEPLGPLAARYPVTVRGAGDDVTSVRQRPTRILALGRGPIELLDALGARPRIVAARSRGAIDLRAAVAARPDLVVATEDADPVGLGQIGRITGAPVYVEPSSSVLDVERAAVDLGFLVGDPVAARQLVGRIRSGIARVRARLENVPPVTVFVDTGFYSTVPARSLLGDLVQLARGDSVAGERPGSARFGPRRVARLDPDVYAATSDSGVTLASLRADPRARRIRAVRRGRFVVLPSSLVEVPGPRVAAGLAAVARALHPDAFR